MTKRNDEKERKREKEEKTEKERPKIKNKCFKKYGLFCFLLSNLMYNIYIYNTSDMSCHVKWSVWSVGQVGSVVDHALMRAQMTTTVVMVAVIVVVFVQNEIFQSRQIVK